MASLVHQEAAAEIHQPTPDIVGNAFVHQYYLILHQSPELVHRFYHDNSKLGRPEQNGGMSTTTTMQAINEKIISLEYGGLHAEISTVDAQESYKGGVLVFVTGYLTGKDNLRQKFSQTFFLAPQDKGYFVLNDVFRYVGDDEPFSEIQRAENYVEAPHTPPAPTPDLPSLQENHFTEQSVVLEEVNRQEPNDPSKNVEVQTVEHEEPIPEVVDGTPREMPNVSETFVESNTKSEEAPKKSYASIVKVMKENPLTLSTSVPAAVKSVAKNQEQQLAPVSLAPFSDTLASNVNGVESGNNQEVEANACSIYIRGMPMTTTHTIIENEFKKFGPIKNGGIQVRNQKGVCFGFVEFEVASAVQSAVEASPITIGGRQVIVEEKRSTARGRGRFSSGRGGGYRNEGPRGNYGGGRGRGDFNSRNEFGNRGNGRGGFSNRGGDRYQRADSMGSSGRMNRGGEMNVNAVNGTMPQQVPASA